MPRQINAEGLAIIKRCESCELSAYRDPVGIPTIGWGHTGGVSMGQRIAQAEADALLEQDLVTFCAGVEGAVAGAPTTDAQFSAMVSLAYNIGLAHFRASTVLRDHVAGDYNGAADAFLMWNKAGGQVMPGLLKRRYQERDLYLSDLPDDQPAPVASDNLAPADTGVIGFFKRIFGAA